jgi:hypothetical protein
MDSLLRRKPRLRRDNQGLDPRLQRRMNDRREQRTVVDRELIRNRTPFTRFQKIFQAQHKSCPPHRAMSVEVPIFFPTRVSKPNVCLLIVPRQMEGNFSLFPFGKTLAFRGPPGDMLTRLKSCDIELVAQFSKPKFEGIPDWCLAASRVGSPPLSKLVGLGQSLIDLFR